MHCRVLLARTVIRLRFPFVFLIRVDQKKILTARSLRMFLQF